MNTFQAWFLWLLGSPCWSDPYQTASARPGPPALIHGHSLVASPVVLDASLTWAGLVHFVQPLAALEALTNIWRSAGMLLLTAQTATRLRAASIDRTENSTSGDPTVSAILISFVRS